MLFLEDINSSLQDDQVPCPNPLFFVFEGDLSKRNCVGPQQRVLWTVVIWSSTMRPLPHSSMALPDQREMYTNIRSKSCICYRPQKHAKTVSAGLYPIGHIGALRIQLLWACSTASGELDPLSFRSGYLQFMTTLGSAD